MEFTGKVLQILPVISGSSAKGEWQKQDVVFEQVDPRAKYPRKACITFFNKPQDVATLKVGEEYQVLFDLDAREYNGRWYSDLRAWKVTPASNAAPSAPMPQEEEVYDAGAGNDMPF